jgi:hypothetical protein
MLRTTLKKFTHPAAKHAHGIVHPTEIRTAIKAHNALKAREQLSQDNLTGLKFLYDGEMAVDCANLFHYKHPDGSFRAAKPPEIKVVEVSDFFGHYYE